MIHRQKHLTYYALLLFILALGAFGIYRLSPNRQAQFYLLLLVTFFYVGWGVLHHMLHHNISTKIVIEYILIGLLGIMAVLFFLKGGLGI